MTATVVSLADYRFKRRRPTSACLSPAYLARIETQRTIACLEAERWAIGERLRHVPESSGLRVDLLLDLCVINADLELLEESLEPAEVIWLEVGR